MELVELQIPQEDVLHSRKSGCMHSEHRFERIIMEQGCNCNSVAYTENATSPLVRVSSF
jgi:hypothetical protein